MGVAGFGPIVSAPGNPQRVFSAKQITVPLAANVNAAAAGTAYWDSAVAGGVTATPSGTTTAIGTFAASVDNTGGAAGAKSVSVNLTSVLTGKFLENDGSVVAATIGATVYLDALGRATTTPGVSAGRAWGVFTDPTTGWQYVQVG